MCIYICIKAWYNSPYMLTGLKSQGILAASGLDGVLRPGCKGLGSGD